MSQSQLNGCKNQKGKLPWKFLWIVLFSIIFIKPQSSFGFFDFIAKKGEDAAKVALYLDSLSELLTEVEPEGDSRRAISELRDQNQRMAHEMDDLYFVGAETHDFVKGPDLTSQRLDENLRVSAKYIRRGKQLVTKLAFLGSEGLTAMNSLQANATLNEIQKNQAVLIAQNQREHNYRIAKEIREEREWQELIQRQRAIRNSTILKTQTQSVFAKQL